MRYLAIIISLGVLIFPSTDAVAAETEQLLVFLQKTDSPVESVFISQHLSNIRKLAEEIGVSLHLINARRGSPVKVAVTPLLVYQNHRGRSIYQGRTNTMDRIRNFIRTSRFVPQGKTLYQRKNLAVWENGRSKSWAPLKVTAVGGHLPPNFDKATFAADAIKDIYAGFAKYRLLEDVTIRRADRGFYMDFHPWLSQDGTLYLSLAAFSQFDCKKPVFTSKVSGSWKNRDQVFGKGAAVLEEAVASIVQNPESGDSFDVVAATTPVKTWEDVGYPLPPKPERKSAKVVSFDKIPLQWSFVKPGQMDPPMIQFRFAPPLDTFAGEVKDAKGEIVFKQADRLNGATGFVEVDTRSAVTMGNAVLDEVIQGSIMLNTKVFPKSTFMIESIESADQAITFGQLLPASVSGTFTLKGKSIKLTCPSEFELGVGEDNTPNLMIRSAFNIDLRTFDIEGADGPEPARFTLLFDVNFILKSMEKS
jgi:polyisoprenoid-binding protein YceI